MDQAESLRPYGGESPPAAERSTGLSPHLSDYWQVVARRLWLVLLVFGVTTAAAIWAVSRQRVYYQAHLALQVNNPAQPARALVTAGAVSGMDIFVDPIESEIQVLRSTQIAAAVVDSLGLRLKPADSDRPRSELFRDARVAPGAVEGRYELVYDAAGRTAELRNEDGSAVASAPVGGRLEASFVGFGVQPPPTDARSFAVSVVSVGAAAGEITDNLTATPRQSTNLIDVYFIGPDRALAPRVLNLAAGELRIRGAQRVQQRATSDISFIEQRLDSARAQLAMTGANIRAFKQSPEYTNLTTQEQQLVNRIQALTENTRRLDERRSALADVDSQLRAKSGDQLDLAAVIAKIPEGVSPEVSRLTNQIQGKRTDMRVLLTQEQLAPGHPRVKFVEGEIASLVTQLAEAVRASIDVIDQQLADQAAESQKIREEQRLYPELVNRLQALEEQRTIDQQTFAFLQTQLYQAQITRAAIGPYVEIIDPATGANRIDPRGRMNVVLGALLGVILGIGAAFFLEYLDRTVRTSSDVETLLGIPVLGIIPRLRRLGSEEEATPASTQSVPLVVALDPLDPAAEAYRNLRMNLMFMSTEEDPIRSILFSSPGPGEGKSTTAVNFAVMLAQQGQRVLLIDADLRRPSLHRSLDLLREPGLTNLLVGDASVREAVRPSVLPNLDVLPSGPFPPNPSELLNSKAMKRLLEEFEGRYSQVIIDSPPMLAVTDAAVLALHADGLVLVMRSGETEQRAAERSVEQLRRLGVRVFGAVLNEVATTTTEESYYLQYYYAYAPSQEGPQEEGWARLKKGFSKARFW